MTAAPHHEHEDHRVRSLRALLALEITEDRVLDTVTSLACRLLDMPVSMVNVVDEDQPLLPLQFGVDGEDYGDESDRGPVFVPADAAIEGGSTADPDPDSRDRHVITVRRGTCDLVELYAAERVRDSSGTVVAASEW